MDENEKNFKTSSKTVGEQKANVLSFFAGAILVVVIAAFCLGIPNVRNVIFGNENTQQENTKGDVSQPSKNEINTTAMEIKNYSETSMAVAEKVLPSIVGIQITYNVSSFLGTSTQTATGSGIIISEDGYILTNNHVVSTSSSTSSYSSFYEVTEADEGTIKVTLHGDETLYDAKLIGKDDQTDLAVIKIDKTGLTKAELGNSDGVKIGEFAMALGCPLGLGTTVTSGIISAVNREITTTDGETYVAIQTDAAINEGNSGGALVNSQGQVIGINTLKLAGTGVGFAIPISSTTEVIQQLIDEGKVIRPWMGVTVQTIDEDDATKYKLVVGAYIAEIEDFSAAQKAGLKAGDVITEVEGTAITNADQVIEIKNKHNVGDTLKMKVYRKGEYRDIELTLEEQP